MTIFKTKLTSDRSLRYKPGYYEDYGMGNWRAVGLSSGFVEPLEATGIHIIIKQIQEFINYNFNLKNLEFNRKSANLINKNIYVDVVNFVALHYNTDRTDSEFWKHVKDNKPDWVKDIDEKIREGSVDSSIYRNNPLSSLWTLDSYIQVTNGLKMISKESIQNQLPGAAGSSWELPVI